MKILIVDDNHIMREMLRMMLGAETNKFFECVDGNASLTLYQQVKPDWVLMDIRMKEMDGITATKKMTEQHPDAKVLIVTEYT